MSFAVWWSVGKCSDTFYILPKMHKQGNPRRPIVSSNGHPTEILSQFVDYHLQPLNKTTNSFIKDTTGFLTKLKQLGHLPNNAFRATLDVSSLYNNISDNEGINEGIDARRHFLNTKRFHYQNRNTLWPHMHDPNYEQLLLRWQKRFTNTWNCYRN